MIRQHGKFRIGDVVRRKAGTGSNGGHMVPGKTVGVIESFEIYKGDACLFLKEFPKLRCNPDRMELLSKDDNDKEGINWSLAIPKILQDMERGSNGKS